MRMLLSIMYYEFLKNIRDIKITAILLVFPLLIVLLLGNAMENIFSEDVIKKIPVGFVNEDSGIIGEEFNTFLLNKHITDRTEIEKFDNKEIGEKAIEKGIVDVMIYIPDQLSENISSGREQSITLYGDRHVEFIQSLISGFFSSHNSINAISVSNNIALPSREESVERILLDASIPDMIDYYSVLMILQVLIIGAIYGVSIVIRQPESDMHLRLHTLPVSRWIFVLGRLVGSVAFLFVISIVFILINKFVFQANWDGNIWIILGTILSFCAICVGMGLLIGTFVSTYSTGLMIVLFLMFFFGTVTGAVTPKSTSDIDIISPNFHAKILLFGTMYGYSKQIMIESALWLGGFIILIYGAAVLGMKRRLKYDHI